jgi:hypothetical protein
MKEFVFLIGTFVVVYLLTPWLAYQILSWALPYGGGAAGLLLILLSIWFVYTLMRRVFGDKLPHV